MSFHDEYESLYPVVLVLCCLSVLLSLFCMWEAKRKERRIISPI